jgi:PilZ domain
MAANRYFSFEPLCSRSHERLNLRNLRFAHGVRYLVRKARCMILKRNFNPSRRSKRQWLNTSVHVFTASAQMDALGINLSAGGMGLFAIANLPLGSRIEVEFLPPGHEERVRVSGAVRHRALYLYGIEFLSDFDRQRSGYAEQSTSSSS